MGPAAGIPSCRPLVTSGFICIVQAQPPATVLIIMLLGCQIIVRSGEKYGRLSQVFARSSPMRPCSTHASNQLGASKLGSASASTPGGLAELLKIKTVRNRRWHSWWIFCCFVGVGGNCYLEDPIIEIGKRLGSSEQCQVKGLFQSGFRTCNWIILEDTQVARGCEIRFIDELLALW